MPAPVRVLIGRRFEGQPFQRRDHLGLNPGGEGAERRYLTRFVELGKEDRLDPRCPRRARGRPEIVDIELAHRASSSRTSTATSIAAKSTMSLRAIRP